MYPPPTPLTSNVAPINYHETPKQKGSIGTIILAIFVLIFLGGLGFWYQNYYNTKKIAISPISSPATTSTENWQTYTNPTYLFSFKYPQNYSITGLDIKAPPGIIIQPNSYSGKTVDELLALPRIFMEIMPQYTNVQDALSEFKKSKSFEVTSITNIKINSLDSVQFNSANLAFGEQPGFDLLITTGDGAVLHMRLTNYQADQKVLDVFNQIISTYQPVNKVALIPADAQTPAAGTCLPSQGSYISIILNEDVPSPRCVTVSSDQHLSLINNTNSPITLNYANFNATIPSKSGYSFPGTVGSIFAPGVHIIKTSLYAGSGPEVWLK